MLLLVVEMYYLYFSIILMRATWKWYLKVVPGSGTWKWSKSINKVEHGLLSLPLVNKRLADCHNPLWIVAGRMSS